MCLSPPVPDAPRTYRLQVQLGPAPGVGISLQGGRDALSQLCNIHLAYGLQQQESKCCEIESVVDDTGVV